MKRYALALWVLGLAACARPVAPEGGPKDTTPPQLVPEKSTTNRSTRFEGKEIRLTFDEWVVLQDAANQVLISPPMVKRPEITLKGKTVTVRFAKEEVLHPNTTYTINFGTAVKDLHENNPAKDLRFVFSTGDFIDSLSLNGIVVDAFTGAPADNITVMLYDNPDDSIVRKERPYYVARTDKSGQFAIPNVRAGVFKCVAVDDANLNLKWDSESERIGFPDSLLIIGDSAHGLPALRIFSPAPVLRLLTRNVNRYGLIKLGFSARPDTVSLMPELPNLTWRLEREQDTLLVWYDHPDSVAWNLVVSGNDTVKVKALSRGDFIAKNRLGFADELAAPAAATRQRNRQSEPATPPPALLSRPPQVVTINPNKPVVLPFNNPLAVVDTVRCLFSTDSTALRDFALSPDSASPRALTLRTTWEEGKTYLLTILPGALTDFFGTANADTLRRSFAVPTEKQLGGLNLTIQSLQTGVAYIVQLMNGANLEEERFFTAETPEQRLVFAKLQPVAYTVQIIEDRNGNRCWDPGDYFGHRQPEAVFIKKLDPLRANWEVEATVQAKVDSGKRGE